MGNPTRTTVFCPSLACTVTVLEIQTHAISASPGFFDSLHGIAPSLFQYGIDCLPRRRYNGIAQFVSFKLYQIKVKNANPIWKNRKNYTVFLHKKSFIQTVPIYKTPFYFLFSWIFFCKESRKSGVFVKNRPIFF